MGINERSDFPGKGINSLENLEFVGSISQLMLICSQTDLVVMGFDLKNGRFKVEIRAKYKKCP